VSDPLDPSEHHLLGENPQQDAGYETKSGESTSQLASPLGGAGKRVALSLRPRSQSIPRPFFNSRQISSVTVTSCPESTATSPGSNSGNGNETGDEGEEEAGFESPAPKTRATCSAHAKTARRPVPAHTPQREINFESAAAPSQSFLERLFGPDYNDDVPPSQSSPNYNLSKTHDQHYDPPYTPYTTSPDGRFVRTDSHMSSSGGAGHGVHIGSTRSTGPAPGPGPWIPRTRTNPPFPPGYSLTAPTSGHPLDQPPRPRTVEVDARGIPLFFHWMMPGGPPRPPSPPRPPPGYSLTAPTSGHPLDQPPRPRTVEVDARGIPLFFHWMMPGGPPRPPSPPRPPPVQPRVPTPRPRARKDGEESESEEE
jgi:hypothetical protein